MRIHIIHIIHIRYDIYEKTCYNILGMKHFSSVLAAWRNRVSELAKCRLFQVPPARTCSLLLRALEGARDCSKVRGARNMCSVFDPTPYIINTFMHIYIHVYIYIYIFMHTYICTMFVPLSR